MMIGVVVVVIKGGMRVVVARIIIHIITTTTSIPPYHLRTTPFLWAAILRITTEMSMWRIIIIIMSSIMLGRAGRSFRTTTTRVTIGKKIVFINSTAVAAFVLTVR